MTDSEGKAHIIVPLSEKVGTRATTHITGSWRSLFRHGWRKESWLTSPPTPPPAAAGRRSVRPSVAVRPNRRSRPSEAAGLVVRPSVDTLLGSKGRPSKATAAGLVVRPPVTARPGRRDRPSEAAGHILCYHVYCGSQKENEIKDGDNILYLIPL